MTFFSLNSIIYSEFHSVFLDTNTTKLEGRSSFHPASPCNLPPGKTVLRNECSSHNGLKRQPPRSRCCRDMGRLVIFLVSQVEATKKETEEELVSYSDYCRNSSNIWQIYESFGFCGACKNHGCLVSMTLVRS